MPKKDIPIRNMAIEDYDAVIELLTATNGVRLRDADSREAIPH